LIYKNTYIDIDLAIIGDLNIFIQAPN